MNADANRLEPEHIDPVVGSAFLDEHHRFVPAPTAEVWSALVTYLAAWNSASTRAYARLVGARPARGTGDFPRRGATLPGFAVSEVDVPHRITLTGRHHFSRYTLTFLLEPRNEGTMIRAKTHADFPGLSGRAYRAAVIGSGAHRVLVGRLLTSVGSRAGRAGTYE